MLKENLNFAPGDIIGLKLVNGDEIISKLESYSNNVYMLDRPCVVVGGPKGIGLVQAMFSLDPSKKIPLKDIHVMMVCETMSKMRDHYLEVTSGIQPVTKGSIIT